MRCRRCKKPRAPNRWTVKACADGRQGRVFYLCNRHDAELNAHVLDFFAVPGGKKKMAAYAQKLGLEPAEVSA